MTAVTSNIVPHRRAVESLAAHVASSPGQRPLSVAIYMHDLTGGGVERQSLTLADELARSGMNVTLVLHRLSGALTNHLPPGLRIVDLRGRRTLEDIPRLARFLWRERPDVLVANLDHNNLAALLAKALALSRTKVIICQHNSISEAFGQFQHWTYRFVPKGYRALAVLTSRAVAVSEGVEEELRLVARLPRRKIMLIHNAVIGPGFEDRSRAAVQHSWLNQPGHPVFVTAGRLVTQKDHATLLRALALHRQRMPSRLLVLGAGPLREELGEMAKRLGVADAVDFLGFQGNPLPWFRAADAFVLSSVTEGFGNVLVEAMGCGTPVISTACQHGPSEILGNGRFGLLVPTQDAAALAAAMDQVASLRQRFPADMLRARAAEFTIGACAARYIALIRSVVPDAAVAA